MGRKLLRKACAKRLSFPTASRGTKPFLEMCFVKPSLTQSRALRVSRHFDRSDGEAWPGGASSCCVPWPPLSLSSLTLGWQSAADGSRPGVANILRRRHVEITSRGQPNMLLNPLDPVQGSGVQGSGARSRRLSDCLFGGPGNQELEPRGM